MLRPQQELDLEIMLVYSSPVPTNLVGKMVNRPGGMLP
jgi:hypothetical protein